MPCSKCPLRRCCPIHKCTIEIYEGCHGKHHGKSPQLSGMKHHRRDEGSEHDRKDGHALYGRYALDNQKTVVEPGKACCEKTAHKTRYEITDRRVKHEEGFQSGRMKPKEGEKSC